jgi:hypothetical protein
MNKRGRIVSAKKRRTAKKEKRLEKAGFFTKKGTFGIVGLTKKRKSSRSRKMRKPLRGGEVEGALQVQGAEAEVGAVETEVGAVEPEVGAVEPEVGAE